MAYLIWKGGITLAPKRTSYRGCLLGLAVGDAMGYTVDSHTLAEIREDYGINGLQGYDPVNGYADVTSYTQIAAFTCNGLLLGLTRGQMTGEMAPFVKYIGLSIREWAASQRPWGRPEQTFCWLLQQPELCRRHCMDTRMLDTLGRKVLGNPDNPKNSCQDPCSITAAVGVGLFAHPDRMEKGEVGQLGAEAVALTHGGPAAFLSGALTAKLISRILFAPGAELKTNVTEALEAFREQFAAQYSQTDELCALVRQAIAWADSAALTPVEVMEKLRCETAPQVLAGAVYACLVSGGDFDSAMFAAVNHSGRSAAVAALAGAMLGAKYGEEILPEFYLDCLEPAELLRELADDLFDGCPMEMGNRLFDLDWDRKYLHGGK